MKSKLRYVGLDVHADQIAVAIADEKEDPRSLARSQIPLRQSVCGSAMRPGNADSCCIGSFSRWACIAL